MHTAGMHTAGNAHRRHAHRRHAHRRQCTPPAMHTAGMHTAGNAHLHLTTEGGGVERAGLEGRVVARLAKGVVLGERLGEREERGGARAGCAHLDAHRFGARCRQRLSLGLCFGLRAAPAAHRAHAARYGARSSAIGLHFQPQLMPAQALLAPPLGDVGGTALLRSHRTVRRVCRARISV